MSPFTFRLGSISGGSGSRHGQGFISDCRPNQVAFGSQRCKVIDCSVECSAYATHQVDNSASHPYYGKARPLHYCRRISISTAKFGVFQTADAVSFDQAGFGSVAKSPAGSFTFQFNQPGVYYYSSGFVEVTNQGRCGNSGLPGQGA